jgi:hypothetical protein
LRGERIFNRRIPTYKNYYQRVEVGVGQDHGVHLFRFETPVPVFLVRLVAALLKGFAVVHREAAAA